MFDVDRVVENTITNRIEAQLHLANRIAHLESLARQLAASGEFERIRRERALRLSAAEQTQTPEVQQWAI
jgi:hypothetical protein